MAADGEAGLGAVVVRRRLPGERHVQQDGTGKRGLRTRRRCNDQFLKELVHMHGRAEFRIIRCEEAAAAAGGSLNLKKMAVLRRQTDRRPPDKRACDR